MKGHLASQYPSSDGEYSDLKVMRSAAGWYIGTEFHHKEGYIEPGSRESEYFSTEEKAEKALKYSIWNQRSHP